MNYTRIWCIILLFFSGCSMRRKSVCQKIEQSEPVAQQPSGVGALRPEDTLPEERHERYAHRVVHESKDSTPEGDAKSDHLPPPRMVEPLAFDEKPTSSAHRRRARTLPVSEHMVKVDFEKEDLATMLNHFAALQKRNLVLPQGPNALQQKVTFKLAHEIPLRSVDMYLDMFLDIAGYSRVPHGPVEQIVRNDGAVVREALPLYVGVPPQKLPNSDERIRALYYLKNLRVPESEAGTEPITAILTSMLSGSRSLTYDPRANALIIADKANLIRAAMTLILELDDLGTKDIIRSMPLYNSSAPVVADILNKQIIAMGGEEQGPTARGETGRYFSPGLRVMPDVRTNTLIVMGREPAVERLQEFVREYIDIPADTGSSILHFYELQYLDAVEFAKVLEKLVKEQVGLSGQATQQAAGGGPVKYFDNVVVVAEQNIAEQVRGGGSVSVSGQAGSATSAAVLEGKVFRAGNRIIVTALKDDWRRIENLIRQLDQPRLQVLVQVLIVDLSVSDNKTLATQLRNPDWMQLPPGFSFQSAQLVPPILDGPINSNPNPPPAFLYPSATTLAADLLRLLAGNLSTSSAAALVANTPANIGSMILSINDPSTKTPGIWAFMQWLSTFFTTKVLQHPYIVVQNHAQGEEYISSIQRVTGPAATGEGGAISTKLVDIPAAIRVAVVPRASSTERLNLQISITIDQFIGTAANRATRQLHTNVNLNSGDILVLGGLTSYEENVNEFETPILGSIPVLKWFFSNTSRNLTRTNLAAFITPTIIEPRIPDGMNAFTTDETHYNYKLMKQDQLLSQLKDPISYLFFNDRNDDLAEMLDEYLAIGKGDFVYDDIGVVPNYSAHKCSPCNNSEQLPERRVACNKKKSSPGPSTSTPKKQSAPSCEQQELDDAERIKQQLASEENPLASSHGCDACSS